MKPLGMEEFSEQAAIGLLGVQGRKHRRDVRGGVRDGGIDRRERAFEKFLEALTKIPPAPCAECPLKNKCGRGQLACEQFWQYIHSMESEPAAWVHSTPPTREPSRRIYDLIYNEASDTRRRPQIRPTTRKPKTVA